jgi:hypothetical protein
MLILQARVAAETENSTIVAYKVLSLAILAVFNTSSPVTMDQMSRASYKSRANLQAKATQPSLLLIMIMINCQMALSRVVMGAKVVIELRVSTTTLSLHPRIIPTNLQPKHYNN